MSETGKCIVCGRAAGVYPDFDTTQTFYVCPVCGRFKIGYNDKEIINNQLAPYLLYNRFDPQHGESRYHTTLAKETCDQYRKEFDSGNITHGRPVHMDAAIVDAWYPVIFAEKIDKILLYLGSKSSTLAML